jgi:hypothetical protein
MKRSLCVLGSAFLLVAVIVAFGFFCETHFSYAQPRSTGTDPETVADQEARRTDRLADNRDQVFRRMQDRVRVVKALIARRLKLFEAAAHFRALDASLPNQSVYRHWLRSHHQGNSDEERLCRRVIECVRVELEDRPKLATEIVERLDAELRRHLKHHKSIRFPEINRG